MERLQGFIVSIHTVTESNLEVEVDTSPLKWDEYRKLIVDLEDSLNDIDLDHSARSELARGRSLKARYRRVSAEDRSRRLRFSPLPGKFTNTLKNLRAYVLHRAERRRLRHKPRPQRTPLESRGRLQGRRGRRFNICRAPSRVHR
jgi:hypothetical protein